MATPIEDNYPDHDGGKFAPILATVATWKARVFLENLAIDAEGAAFVIVHGRFSGFGAPVNWIAADILRIEDGVLLELWDVIQDEATQEQSKSGRSMFGDSFPRYR